MQSALRGFKASVSDAVRPYEPDVERAIERFVRRGDVCADVGANRGYFSLQLARKVGRNGRVAVFEAHPENARLIERRARRRGLSRRVTVVNAAASDEVGAAQLFPGRDRNSGEWALDLAFASRSDVGPVERLPIDVKTTTLDMYFGSGRLDVVKIDVEGAEGRVVAGMGSILAHQRPVIILESHGRHGWEAVASLMDAGYSIERTDGEPLNPAGPSDVPYHLCAVPTATSTAAANASALGS